MLSVPMAFSLCISRPVVNSIITSIDYRLSVIYNVSGVDWGLLDSELTDFPPETFHTG